MSELKPCPFCGELPIQFVKDGLTQIRCNNTQCWIVPATSFYTDRKTAVEAWEERAQPADEPLVTCGECVKYQTPNCAARHEQALMDFCSHGIRKPGGTHV